MEENIEQIILISGKRKCGKDFISGKLYLNLGANSSQVIRISEPIKSEWAKKLNLDLNDLLSDSPLKEKYRKDMIVWSDSVRLKDYGFFCRQAMTKANKRIVIVSDIRRRNDIKFFKENYGTKVKTVRISCSDKERIRRGFQFEVGVDDVESECGLDDYNEWNLIIENDCEDINVIMKKIIENIIH